MAERPRQRPCLGSTREHERVGLDLTVLANGRASVAALHAEAIDPARLDQAIVNLVVNARDAMARGGGRLTIRTSNVELGMDSGSEAGPYVCVAVADTGCGMPPDVVEQAFQPFFTTKGEGEGTGLGLSTVRAVVEEAGGALHVDSW